MGTSAFDRVFNDSASPRARQGVSTAALDAAWEDPVVSAAEHRARVAAALGRARDVEDQTGGALMTAARSFAGGVEDVGKTFLRGTGQIVGNLGDTLGAPTVSALGAAADRLAAMMGRHQAGVVPTPEEQGRSPWAAATGAIVGEAAPQFALGEVAGRAAVPLTRLVGRMVPSLAPSLGPAVMDSPWAAAAKAAGRAVVPQVVTQTATFAPLAKDQPVSPMGIAMGALGSLGDAAAAYRGATPAAQQVGALAAARQAREAARAEIVAGLPAREARALRRESQAAERSLSANPAGPTVRVPATDVGSLDIARALPDNFAVETADTRVQTQPLTGLSRSVVAPQADVAPPASEAFPEGFSTKSMATTRRPAAAFDAVFGNDPSLEGQPEVASTLRVDAAPSGMSAVDRMALLDEVLAEQGLPPRSTRSSGVPDLAPPQISLRPSILDTPQGPLQSKAQLEAAERALSGEASGEAPPGAVSPVASPSPEPLVAGFSAGSDLSAPGRIPEDAPPLRRVPRGIDPWGNIVTPEGAVSVGRGGGAVPLPPSGEVVTVGERAGQRLVSGHEPPLRTKAGLLVKNLTGHSDDTLLREFADAFESHRKAREFVEAMQSHPDFMAAHELLGGGHVEDARGIVSADDWAAMLQAEKDVARRTPEIEALSNELRRRGIDPTDALTAGEGGYPTAWDEGGVGDTGAEGTGGGGLPGVSGTEPGLVPLVGTGPTKTRGLARGVQEKAVAQRLVTSLGDLPEYQTANMADQAGRAIKLLAENAPLARRIALGEAVPPADLLPESVFIAVENKAFAEGDVGTLRELASGKLTEVATTMGQRIRTLAERDPESPVAAMQKIMNARTASVPNAKMTMETAVQELQRHVAEAVKMDPPAWARFIDSLRC